MDKKLIGVVVMLAIALLILAAIIGFYTGFKIGPPEGPLVFLARIINWVMSPIV